MGNFPKRSCDFLCTVDGEAQGIPPGTPVITYNEALYLGRWEGHLVRRQKLQDPCQYIHRQPPGRPPALDHGSKERDASPQTPLLRITSTMMRQFSGAAPIGEKPSSCRPDYLVNRPNVSGCVASRGHLPRSVAGPVVALAATISLDRLETARAWLYLCLGGHLGTSLTP